MMPKKGGIHDAYPGMINCHRNAHFHLNVYRVIPAIARIVSNSFRLKDLSTDNGASHLTIADFEKIRVSSRIE